MKRYTSSCSIFKNKFLSLLILAFGILLTCTASARMKPLTVTELVKQSTHVVEAELLKIDSHWSADKTYIYTAATFKINSVLRGKIASENIVVYLPGGEIGNTRQLVIGAPDFSPGEKSLLILRAIDQGLVKGNVAANSFNIISLSQGKFSLVKDTTTNTTRAVSAARAYFAADALKNSQPIYNANGIPLQNLRKQVEALNQKSAR
ncbi:MAG: hypothetical protein P8Y45_15105 [Exilibacterium sp.]